MCPPQVVRFTSSKEPNCSHSGGEAGAGVPAVHRTADFLVVPLIKVHCKGPCTAGHESGIGGNNLDSGSFLPIAVKSSSNQA